MTTNLTSDVIAEIVRRLAHAFPVVGCSFAPGELVEADDISQMLGGIDWGQESDEVGMLFRMGVLKESSIEPGGCTPAEMLRFLEEHGEAWYLARLEMVRAELRKSLTVEVESNDAAEQAS